MLRFMRSKNTLSGNIPSASDPWIDGLPPHVPARGPLPRVCLLPGDPDRVPMTREVLSDFEEIGYRREFRLATGAYNGTPLAVCSTGIGGPSTEIAVVELSRLGVDTFIRVGGMGAIPTKIAPGTITNVTVALREGGAAKFYTRDTEPLLAHTEVVSALNEAALGCGEILEPISVLSCDSYYIGEGRPLAGLELLAHERFQHVLRSGADAMDMECETLFAVACALKRRYGAILATHGNRTTDEWLHDYGPVQLRMIEIACRAASALVG